MKKIFSIVVLFFALAATALAQGLDAPLPNDPSVRYGKLENGLTYYIQHNEKPAQRAEFYFVANVGAIQETKAQSGLAHFQEHMALNGTKNLPGKMMLDYFQKNGVEFGRNINAGTGVEQTMYMLNNIPVTRQGIIDTAMLIMHDYCGFVSNEAEEVNKERGVIVEEWRTRRTADWRMHEKELPYLYAGSPYAECTLIGSKENLETFDPSEIVKFYTTWYRPDLEAIIVVGDIDVDAIEKLIKERFADLPVVENPVEKVMPTIPDNETTTVGIITDPEASETEITVYLKSDKLPKQYDGTGIWYFNEISEYLISSMINERLTDMSKQVDAPFISARGDFTQFVRTKDAFIGNIITKDGEGINGFTAFMTEMERIKRFGFTQDEFDRAKTNYLRYMEQQKDNAGSRQNGQMVYPMLIHFLMGAPYMAPEYEYELAKQLCSFVTVDQMNQAVAQSLVFGKNTIVIYKSIEKEGLTHPVENDFLAAMAAATAAELQAPVQETINEPLIDPALTLKGSPVKKTVAGPFGSTEWILKNGIRVIVKPTDFNKEQVLFSISNDGGRSLIEDKDIASFESNVFQTYASNAGLSNFPAQKLNKMLTGKMVNVNPVLSDFAHGVSGSCSPKDFETMLQLAYLCYTAPRFEESEFKPGMDQLKALVPNLATNPNYVFQSEMMKYLYQGNPRDEVLSVETLAKFDFSTLERVTRSLYSNAAGAVVTIVGNVDAESIKPLVEKYIGSLPVGKKATKAIDRNEDMIEGVLNHPIKVAMNTPKAIVCLVLHGDMPYTAENNIKLNALTYILDLVYTEVIREQEGGTYGVTSLGNMMPEPDPNVLLQIVFETNPESVTKLTEMTKAELAKIATEGPSQDFVNKAKENFLKNIPENRISNSYWKNSIKDLVKYGVDMDTDYEAIVNALTVESIRDFTKQILDYNNYVDCIMTPAE